jgi:hypothetical protein
MKKDQSGRGSKAAMIGLVIAVVLGLIFVGIALSGGDPAQDCPPGMTWSDAHQHCH